MQKKKILIIMISIVLILSVIGISYAVWTLNLTQTSENDIASTCFNISFTEKDNISLQKSYPLYDKDGKKLTPYEFTITNNCDSSASYAVNLEVLNTSTLTNNDAVKVMFSKKEDNVENELKLDLLSNYETVTKTLNNAKSSFNLTTGYLDSKESKTYDLRLWLDENVTTETLNIQNTTFNSKVIVTAKYETDIPYATSVVSNLAAKADISSTDVYTVPDKTSSSCTYTLAYDGTSDNNLRYVGANPCNYVTFNGETAGWRIIGVLNTPEGQRLKIIRANSIGRYSWDNKASGTGSSKNSYGSNDWTDSALKEVLNNGAYYNKTSGICPSGQNGAITSCDFTSNGLIEVSKKQIDTITWKLGGIGTEGYTSSSNGLASHWYTYERGTKVYTGRPIEWKGKVGLMYPSDYGYATSGNSSMSRINCLNKELYNWNDTAYSDCYNNDWLLDTSNLQWTLTPYSSGSSVGFLVRHTGRITTDDSSDQYEIRPSIYLISKTTILGGEGTPENPYVLAGD